MLRSEAVARIKRGLGFRTDLDNEIVSALQEAQRLLERGRTLPYFLVVEDEILAVPSGSGEVALPERFLREKEDEPLRYVDEKKLVVLSKIDISIGSRTFFEEGAGAPIAYTLRKDTIKFWPDRDKNYTLTWSYYRGAQELNADVENEWLEKAPEVLIGRAGMLIAEDLSNVGAYNKFLKMYQEAWGGMFADSEMRVRENAPLRMGERL